MWTRTSRATMDAKALFKRRQVILEDKRDRVFLIARRSLQSLLICTRVFDNDPRGSLAAADPRSPLSLAGDLNITVYF